MEIGIDLFTNKQSINELGDFIYIFLYFHLLFFSYLFIFPNS